MTHMGFWPGKLWRRRAQQDGAVGWDRTPQQWRMVHLIRDKGQRLRLQAASVLEAAADCRAGVLAQPPTLRLRSWLAGAGVQERRMVAGLAPPDVQLLRMSVPAGLRESEMEQLALAEAARQTGRSPAACCVDFCMPGSASPAPDELELVVAIAPSDAVQALQQHVDACGLELQVLELASHAARAAAMHAWRAMVSDAGGLQAILVWQEEAARVLWMHEGHLIGEFELPAVQVHALPLTGMQLTGAQALEPVRALWLAAEVCVSEGESDALRDSMAAAGGAGMGRPCAMHWLHPFAGLEIADDSLRKLLPAQAAMWWTACGLALRGVHAWSC